MQFSKTSLNENTEIYTPESEEFKYRNMTKTVESVAVTPMQIILKISSKRENVSYASISNTGDKDYIGLMKYKAYDQNGIELGMKDYQTMQKITYANGKSEEWGIGDIGTYINFENATMELTEYMIIEKKENIEKIVINPIVIKDHDDGTSEDILLDEFTVNLK